MSNDSTNLANTVGLVTLGRLPREDFEQVFATHLGGVSYQMVGALDDVPDGQVRQLHEPAGEYPIHIPVAGGIDAPMAQIVPLVQASIDGLVRAGIGAIAVLCAGDLEPLEAPVPLISAGRVVPHLVTAVQPAGGPIGIVTPNEGQVEYARRKWNDYGFDAHVVSIPPYTGDGKRSARLHEVGTTFALQGYHTIVLDCFGFGGEDARDLFRHTGVLTLSARDLAARATGAICAVLNHTGPADGAGR